MAETARERVRRHRAQLRRRGLRPIQFWVPDTRSTAFRTAAHRQSQLLGAAPEEEAIMDWIETETADAWDDQE